MGLSGRLGATLPRGPDKSNLIIHPRFAQTARRERGDLNKVQGANGGGATCGGRNKGGVFRRTSRTVGQDENGAGQRHAPSAPGWRADSALPPRGGSLSLTGSCPFTIP